VRVVIIGNSAGAIGAVEAIREHDQAVDVVVVSEEPHAIYSWPLLDHFLAGEIDRPRLAYRPTDFYCRHNVQPLLGTRVVAVHPNAHTLETEDGTVIPYDKLLVATGGTPIVPAIEGLETRGVYTFTRLDDALDMMRFIERARVRRAVVVGGGMIGIKITNALTRRGVAVALVELAPRILSAALDEAASTLLAGVLSEAGVQILTGTTVDEVHQRDGRVTAVSLQGGHQVPCDLLVFGIGVRPNAGLGVDAGLAVNRGIVVDEHMRTSHEDIYAAGDVAEAYDIIVDMNRTVAIWPNAYRQGAIAGLHMVGVSRADPGGLAMNALSVCDVPAISVGDGNAPETDVEVLSELNKRERRYRRLVIRDGRLVGAILVGQISRAGIYTGLIRNRVDIRDCYRNLMSEQFGLLSLPAHYRKHIVTGAGIEV